ncbi:polysaccharide deacetylase family protein [Microbulbifer harenosus]|uniref:NodB homology domain-containing protein n=1 Tax=Microbulbifer harenosus TaxID=2576840 RepID=A0ABY2UK76_9GAMM|nr:polysaccharide deacetylase family protein [Microbulbifer harenosus]TLM78353.1 hypothetical protein FDY93_06030 [Microbulbifer harenosus]
MSTMKSLRILLRRTMAIAVLTIPLEATSGEDRRIALAFDDFPSTSSNEGLLDELERLDIKATFFQETPALTNEAKSAKKRGKIKTQRSRGSTSTNTQREIDGATRILRSLDEHHPSLLTPSFARQPEKFEQGQANTNYWNFPGDALADLDAPQEIAELLAENAFPGAVVILHPRHKRREHILRALPVISERLKAEGYEFATLSELISPKNASKLAT